MTAALHGRITEERIAEVMARIGREFPIEHPFLTEVNADSIRRAAEAVGDDNPLYTDADYAARGPHRGLIAPPAWLYAAGWGAWDVRRGEGLSGVHGLHVGDRWTYLRPLRRGDVIHAVAKLTGLQEISARPAGRRFLQSRMVTFYDQNDTPVASWEMKVIRQEFGKAKEEAQQKREVLTRGIYTAEEIARIQDEIMEQLPRGAEPRAWEDVQVGEAMQPLTRGPLTQVDMLAWRMAMGGGFVRSGRHWVSYIRQHPRAAPVDPATGIPESVARVHWDEGAAARVGIPAPYDFGSQRGGWATVIATNWMGDTGWMSDIDIRYTGLNFVGDTVRFTGAVADKRPAPDGGPGGIAVCDILATNQRGHEILRATATIVLPGKGH